MNRFLTDAILTTPQREAGMVLVEDDHNVYLMREWKPELLTIFTTQATAEQIVTEADKYLQEVLMEQQSGK